MWLEYCTWQSFRSLGDLSWDTIEGMTPAHPLILIAGLSCSGKTTLARELGVALNAPVLGLDHYYFPLAHLSESERHEVNFDLPEILDWRLIEAHVQMLMEGKAVEVPRYDFVHFTRSDETETLQPGAFVIVEGQLAFYNSLLVRLADTRLFLDVPPEECFERRLKRDVQERGRTPEEVEWRYSSHVLPVYREFMLPMASRATQTCTPPWVPAELAITISNALKDRAILL